MLKLIELNAGVGPCLILIHGTAGSPASTWGAFANCLQGQHRILAFDFSRLAHADVLAQSLEGLARLLAAQIEDCAEGHVHLIGYSLGAALAIEVASIMPGNVLSLTLVAPFDHSRDARVCSNFEHWRQLLNDNPRALATQIVAQGFCTATFSAMGAEQLTALTEAFYLRVDWPSVAAQLALNLSLDVSARVSRLRCPTAVVIGAADQLIPARVSISLYERLADGRLFTLPCGHLIPAEDPEGLAKIVCLFVSGRTLPVCYPIAAEKR
jgi:pimeloyl-ACP methyl ester carboxylesterase